MTNLLLMNMQTSKMCRPQAFETPTNLQTSLTGAVLRLLL